MSIDDDLDQLLQGAFDQARPTGHEDLRGLREGAVAKAHGLRRRKRIGTTIASAVASAALVGGVGGLAAGGWLGVGTGSTVGSPASQASSAPAADQTSAPVTPRDLATFIPSQDSLPEGVVYDGAVRESPTGVTAMGLQVCDSRDDAVTAEMAAAPDPVAHADHTGYDIQQGQVVGSVSVTANAWAKGTGAQVFGDLRDNTMACRWLGPHERLSWSGRDSASTWLSVHRNGDFVSHLAAQRVGDIVVAVVVDYTKPHGQEDAAKKDAIRLCDEMVAKLKASNLPAATGR